LKPVSISEGEVVPREWINPKMKRVFQFNMKKHYLSFATWWYKLSI
jgi:hypothetical protein